MIVTTPPDPPVPVIAKVPAEYPVPFAEITTSEFAKDPRLTLFSTGIRLSLPKSIAGEILESFDVSVARR